MWGQDTRTRVPVRPNLCRAVDFVALTGLTAPALLGWGLRVIVCAWSVSVWVGPR